MGGVPDVGGQGGGVLELAGVGADEGEQLVGEGRVGEGRGAGDLGVEVDALLLELEELRELLGGGARGRPRGRRGDGRVWEGRQGQVPDCGARGAVW